MNNKKRQADVDLNQDNAHKIDQQAASNAQQETWKKAPDDVLATRKILKVSGDFLKAAAKPTAETITPAGGGGGGFAAYAKINPFAAMGPPMGFSSSSSKGASTSAATPSVITNSKPKDVPVASSSPKINPFGASSPAHNPFMNFVGESKPNVDYWQKFKEPIKVPSSEAVSSSDVKVTFVNPSSSTSKKNESTLSAFTTSSSKNSSNIDDDKSNDGRNINSSTSSSTSTTVSSGESQVLTHSSGDNDEGEDGGSVEGDDASPSSVISEKKPAIDTAAMFHKPAELDNGESGETCVLKLRAKLYRLAAAGSHKQGTQGAGTKEWVEVGTGPVRLLTPSGAASTASSSADAAAVYPRIVMRREHQAGGPGTKVILNASFRSHFSVAKMGERAARLTCLAAPPEAGPSTPAGAPSSASSVREEEKKEEKEEKEEESEKPVAIPTTFLFKMQHSHEADQFIKHIDEFLQQSRKEEQKN